MKYILILLLGLITFQVNAQTGKIIGGTPPRYINRVAVKPDTTLFATNNATADLTALGDVLGGRSTITLVVTKSDAVPANPLLPAITDTLLGTKIKVKVYLETSSEQIGVFQSDLGFVIGFDGTAYTDNNTLVFIQDFEEYTFWPVEDVNGYHWAYTQTSGVDADGNGIYSGSDSLSQENTYAKMAGDGSQSFGLGYFPSFPSLAYDGTDYGSYISPSNSIVANIHGDVLQELFDDNYRVGTYDFTGTNSGKYAQILINKSDNAVKFAGVESGSYSYKFPTSSPSTTTGRKQFIEWDAGLPSFKDRYVTDKLWSDVNIKMDASQTFAIGNWPSFPDRDYDYVNEFGLYVSPDYYGEVTLANRSDYISLYNGEIEIGTGEGSAGIGLDAVSRTIISTVYNLSSQRRGMYMDTFRIELINGNTKYRFTPDFNNPPPIAAGMVTTLSYTGNGGTAVPSYKELKRDTTVSYNNVDYNLLSSGLTSSQVLNRYNNVIITGYVPSSGVSSDALLFLPAPSADYNQVTIYLTAYDENATYGIGISATTNGIAYGDGTYGDAYPGGAIPVGAEVKIRCKIDPKSGTSTYKWFLN
jgi:hypothetical protein